MKNRRWSDTNYHLWPFTLSPDCYSKLGFVIDSGAHEGGKGDCHLRIHLFRLTLLCELPPVIPDYRERHLPKWDTATVARIGRDWYDEHFPREYGFTLSEGNLHVYYGAQTHDSRTDQNSCFFLPWRHWRFIRHSHYDLEGKHFHTEHEKSHNAWQASTAIRDACPKVRFEFEDYDGQKIVATTHIEEREWHFGTGLFRWLSWFRKPSIKRSLALDFSAEVGREKGSWKGGTLGTSIEMLPGELHEAAFRRYCEKDHRSKNGKYRIRYIGPASIP